MMEKTKKLSSLLVKKLGKEVGEPQDSVFVEQNDLYDYCCEETYPLAVYLVSDYSRMFRFVHRLFWLEIAYTISD
jgi:hypothetical protein